MNEAHWSELQRLLDGALEQPADVRAGWLSSVCADPDLCERVLSLLQASERTGASGLFSASAAEFAAPMLAELAEEDEQRRQHRRAEALTTVIECLHGRYEFVGEIGRGGMATVFLARDLRHGRQVAVKVLDSDAHTDPAQFLAEIRMTARLNHPHILPIHDSGECSGGMYYVMPHVSGETLRARLRRDGRPGVDESIRLIREIADALAYAHGEGIVHRDLKPENILLSGGHAVIADFGIARALEAAAHDGGAYAADATSATTSLGTPAYMAPEQARAGPVNERADLYSLGVIAYELLCGRHPYGALQPYEHLAAHLNDEPEIPPLDPDVPRAFGPIVRALLSRDPGNRPPRAAALLTMLDEAVQATHRQARRRRTMLVAGIAILAVAAAAAYLATSSGRAPPLSTTTTVAVLPFDEVGAVGEEYFGVGVAEDLAYALSRTPGLRVVGATSSRSVRERFTSMRDIARSLGANVIVTGTVYRAEGGVRVQAELVNGADGTIIAHHSVESGIDEPAMHDSVTTALASTIGRALGRPAAVATSVRGTSDQEAHDLYLQGRFHMLERGAGNVQLAVDYFSAAVRKDPAFARAHAALALTYAILPSYLPLDGDSISRLVTSSAGMAMSLDSTLADARVAYGTIFDRTLRFTEAERHYRAALASEPSNVMVHHWLGGLLLTVGRTEEAIDLLRRGAQLDPLAKSAGAAHASALSAARRHDAAAEEAKRILALDGTFPLAMLVLGEALVHSGHADSAVRVVERAVRLHPDMPSGPAALMTAYAAAGRRDDVLRTAASFRGRNDMAARMNAAIADHVLGDHAPLLALLTTRAGQLQWMDQQTWFGCNPLFDPLWTDRRFVTAMKDIGIARCDTAAPWRWSGANTVRQDRSATSSGGATAHLSVLFVMREPYSQVTRSSARRATGASRTDTR